MAPQVAEAFANFSEGQQVAQRQYMLQLVLLDRFNLIVRHAPTTSVIYELVIADQTALERAIADSGCAKATMSTVGCTDSGIVVRSGRLSGRGVCMSDLVGHLGTLAGRLVVDKTGFIGKFDINLHWTQDTQAENPYVGSGLSSSASLLIAALREQYGLTLRPTEEAIDAIVVDHVQTPVVDYPLAN